MDTTATICDEQDYDLIDRFLMRAAVDAQITRISELATFLGISEPLVRRCLKYLATIQHLRLEGDTIWVSELGMESVRADVRYEWKESRQKLLIERHTYSPMPRRHYGGTIPILTEPTVDRDRVYDGSLFTPLFSTNPFQDAAVLQLENRSDRPAFNLPRQLRNLRVVESQDAYLPAYIIETEDHGLLVYTMAAPERDGFLEEICRLTPAIHDRIRIEKRPDPQELWTEWLANGRAGVGTLRQLPSGLWRATYGSDAFGEPKPKHPVNRVGSFHMHRNQFIQLWCDDKSVRQVALVERAFSIVRSPELGTVAEYERQIADVATQLELAPLDAEQVRRRAVDDRRHDVVAGLDRLA